MYDIWEHSDLGTATGVISTNVPSHGVRLLRLGNKKADPADGIGTIQAPDEKHAAANTGQGQPGIYDLSGRQVSNDSANTQASLGKLPKGLYVVKGKSVLVR